MKNLRFALAALATLTVASTPAFADGHTVDDLVAQCEADYPGDDGFVTIARELCTNDVLIMELRARMARSEDIDMETRRQLQALEARQQAILAELAQNREDNEAVLRELAAIRAMMELSQEGQISGASTDTDTIQVDHVETTPLVQASQPVQQAQPMQSTQGVGGQPVTFGGVAHRRVVAPHLVSIYGAAVPDGQRLHLTDMRNGAKRWAPGGQEVRVAILNQGRPCQPDFNPDPVLTTSWCNVVVPEGYDPMLSGFEAGYVDLNEDGRTDNVPALLLNPKPGGGTVDLYMSWRQQDNITLVWLVNSGVYEQVEVAPGLWQQVPVWVPYAEPGKGQSSWGGNRKGGTQKASAASGTPNYDS